MATEMTFQQATREYQIRYLLGAQAHLAKTRGFPLPDDVSLEVQEIMTKIPGLIRRLEAPAPATEGAPVRDTTEGKSAVS